MSGEGRQWQGTTDGASWMHRALIVLMGFTPLRVIYFFMYFAIPVYMVANRKGYLSIYHYFRRRLGYGPLRSFFHVVANHAAFGKVVVDRFGAYAGKNFSIEVPDMELYSSLSSRPEGMMQVSSHIGNDEMAGYFLKASKRIYALAFGGEVSSVTENRVKMLSCNDITLVPIADDMSHLVVLNNALAGGEIVNIHGDRVFGSSKTFRCRVMGAPASLPAGPFMLAAMRGVPAVSVFVMRTGCRKYKVLLFRLDEGLEGLERNEKAERMARAYAASIDSVLALYPDQWFNFYEYWDE